MNWISVKDELPNEPNAYDNFLITYEWTDVIFDTGQVRMQVEVARFNSFHKLFVSSEGEPIDDENTKVTHWMPLPEPPKE